MTRVKVVTVNFFADLVIWLINRSLPGRWAREEYLASPDETDVDIDLLKYWKEAERKWPALAKMAKQYLEYPPSSGRNVGHFIFYCTDSRVHQRHRYTNTLVPQVVNHL